MGRLPVWLMGCVAMAGCRQVVGLDDPLAGSAIVVDQQSIDFETPCGGTSSQPLLLHDSGDLPIMFAISADVPGMTVSPTSGTIQPGEHATITVTAMTDPIGIPGVPMSGEIQVTTDNPAIEPFTIPVSITSVGAVIVASKSTLDFGQVTTATAHDNTVTLTNSGNSMVTVMAGPFINPTFSITSGGSVDLAPQGSADIGVEFNPPASQAYAYELPLLNTGALCQSLPRVNVTGVGTTNAVLLDYTTVDFGDVACGSGADSRTITLTNSNGASYAYTASVTVGMASYSVNPTSGTVPAMAATSVDVSRVAAAVPSTPGMVIGNLRINVSGAGGNTDIPLQYNVTGSFLTPDMTSIDFGQVNYLSSGSTKMVTITNSGNQVASVQVMHSGSATYTAASSFQISANTSKAFSITFKPTSTGTFTGAFMISDAAGCSSPFTINVTGRGDN